MVPASRIHPSLCRAFFLCFRFCSDKTPSHWLFFLISAHRSSFNFPSLAFQLPPSIRRDCAASAPQWWAVSRPVECQAVRILGLGLFKNTDYFEKIWMDWVEEDWEFFHLGFRVWNFLSLPVGLLPLLSDRRPVPPCFFLFLFPFADPAPPASSQFSYSLRFCRCLSPQNSLLRLSFFFSIFSFFLPPKPSRLLCPLFFCCFSFTKTSADIPPPKLNKCPPKCCVVKFQKGHLSHMQVSTCQFSPFLLFFFLFFFSPFYYFLYFLFFYYFFLKIT